MKFGIIFLFVFGYSMANAGTLGPIALAESGCLSDRDDQVCYMLLSWARTFCQERGGRVPTAAEVIEYMEQHGAETLPLNEPKPEGWRTLKGRFHYNLKDFVPTDNYWLTTRVHTRSVAVSYTTPPIYYHLYRAEKLSLWEVSSVQTNAVRCYYD